MQPGDRRQQWLAADKEYQLHHVKCAHCKAAGLTPGKQPRCHDGAKLWQAYCEAGEPVRRSWGP